MFIPKLMIDYGYILMVIAKLSYQIELSWPFRPSDLLIFIRGII